MDDEWINKLSEADLTRLAVRLEPHFKRGSLNNTRVFGDPNRLHIGAHVSLVDTLFNTVCGHVRVGDYAFFGHGVMVLTGTHEAGKTDLARQAGVPSEGRDVTIGRGAWIASGTIVLGPCRIGADAVIGAGSVVLGGEVPDGWFYAGNPAQPIKRVVGEAALPRASRVAPVRRLAWRQALGRLLAGRG